MLKNVIIGFALGFVGLGATTASAQEVANNSTFGDWVVRCQAVTTSQTSCRLVQVLTRSEEKTLVARFIGIPGAGNSTMLLAQVPIGVFLPGGAVFRTQGSDPEEQKKMVWQRCLGEICEAAIVLTPGDLIKFTTDGTILFGYRMELKADPIVVQVDVSRFEEAIAAIAPKSGE